jgi:branched-chain amino acid aminotransferase
MNMINYNTQLLAEWPPELLSVQRGLYYGDALFESIRVFGGRIPLMAAHWERLSGGLQAWGYALPTHWSADFFEKEILRAAFGDARVRLTIWRSPGGLYFPQDDTPQFLISAAELSSSTFDGYADGLSIGLCQGVRLSVDSLSGWKTPNGARYVAAAKEAYARGWDDAIILNSRERICEATSSNIFWIADHQVCTVPLSDGPVTGILRNLLLHLLPEAGYKVVEKSASFEELKAADEVFLTNAVRGIRRVARCEEKVFKQNYSGHFNYLLAEHLKGILDRTD